MLHAPCFEQNTALCSHEMGQQPSPTANLLLLLLVLAVKAHAKVCTCKPHGMIDFFLTLKGNAVLVCGAGRASCNSSQCSHGTCRGPGRAATLCLPVTGPGHSCSAVGGRLWLHRYQDHICQSQVPPPHERLFAHVDAHFHALEALYESLSPAAACESILTGSRLFDMPLFWHGHMVRGSCLTAALSLVAFSLTALRARSIVSC